MLAQGDVVTLPHGRGVGLVLWSRDDVAHVFTGREAYGAQPRVEPYVECELMYQGRNMMTVARSIVGELEVIARRRRGATWRHRQRRMV